MKVLLSIPKFLPKTLIFDCKSTILPLKLISKGAHGVSFSGPIKGLEVTRNFRGVPYGNLEESSGLETLL
jgi:hypothetical protein